MKNQSLDNLQRWMQSVITHPGGVEAGLATPAARAHLEMMPADIEQVIEPSHSQSSIERLSIYAGAYYTRLIECLQAEFPVFRQTVGDDAFADFAIDYLQRYPSQSYTLAKLGEHFVAYLRETKPAQPGAANWADFLIDLARLEQTISEVFDGPGIEARSPLPDSNVPTMNADQFPQARLTTVPCLRLLALRFSLHDYYTAIRANKEVSLPQPKDSWLAITRRDYIVRRYQLSHPQFVLLDALQHGQTIGDAITCAAAIYPGQLDQLAADLQQWFHIWTAAPMFEKPFPV
ncbi:MAG TPA: DNA-binding domain-containing protein [Pirellulales bacterium]|jgi:hypothetical protein